MDGSAGCRQKVPVSGAQCDRQGDGRRRKGVRIQSIAWSVDLHSFPWLRGLHKQARKQTGTALTHSLCSTEDREEDRWRRKGKTSKFADSRETFRKSFVRMHRLLEGGRLHGSSLKFLKDRGGGGLRDALGCMLARTAPRQSGRSACWQVPWEEEELRYGECSKEDGCQFPLEAELN
mmetsp:Transcript_1681/g.3466  ORF Transcript_1681/g.3466 Transcript_1681/m.3466 type:complete len:177 (+) Transcript_1681:1090-1620(+)